MPSAAETAPIVERIDTYAEWQKREEVPVVNGIYIRDMKTVPVGDWPRKGVKGSLIYLDGEDGEDVHLVEIPPGASTTPERHMYDEAIYVVSGRGTASVWYDERKKQTFEWGEGSFFCLPTNVNYQFFNISGSQPARYFSVTNLPAMLRQFHSEDFIFNCPFAFTDRYSGDSDYFSGEGKLYRGRQWETNFVPDIRRMKLFEWKERGGGGTNAFFMLAGGTINSHVSRFQVGTYKKAHTHGPWAHLYVIQGDGYVLTQRGNEPRIRCDWSEGSLYLSGAGEGQWLHQHFNVGQTPAAYLVLGVGKSVRYATSRWNANQRTDKRMGELSADEGGWQTEYNEEDPEIHAIFEAELAKRGVQCRMKNLSPYCTGTEGPSTQGEWGDEH